MTGRARLQTLLGKLHTLTYFFENCATTVRLTTLRLMPPNSNTQHKIGQNFANVNTAVDLWQMLEWVNMVERDK
jgi:hypothetical protein